MTETSHEAGLLEAGLHLRSASPFRGLSVPQDGLSFALKQVSTFLSLFGQVTDPANAPIVI